MRGRVHCSRNIMLVADQALVIRYSGNLRRVRAYYFRYVAWVVGGHTVLKHIICTGAMTIIIIGFIIR